MGELEEGGKSVSMCVLQDGNGEIERERRERRGGWEEAEPRRKILRMLPFLQLSTILVGAFEELSGAALAVAAAEAGRGRLPVRGKERSNCKYKFFGGEISIFNSDDNQREPL